MSLNDKVRLISSILSSLTLSDLEFLREEIDSLISTKNVENTKKEINELTYNASMEFLNSIAGMNGLTIDPSTFKAIIHPAEEGGYWAEVPALPGCITEGDTIEEVMANLKDAIEGWLEVANSRNAIEPTDQVVEIAV